MTPLNFDKTSYLGSLITNIASTLLIFITVVVYNGYYTVIFISYVKEQKRSEMQKRCNTCFSCLDKSLENVLEIDVWKKTSGRWRRYFYRGNLCDALNCSDLN